MFRFICTAIDQTCTYAGKNVCQTVCGICVIPFIVLELSLNCFSVRTVNYTKYNCNFHNKYLNRLINTKICLSKFEHCKSNVNKLDIQYMTYISSSI